MTCEDLPDGIDVGEAVEHVAAGSVPPPASFDYHDPLVRPNTIVVYESQPLHATRVRTHVAYFTDQACHERHEAALEVDVP